MRLNRRKWLRGTGGLLLLPQFESLADNQPVARADVKRLVCVGNLLGFYPGAFWPAAIPADTFRVENYRFGQSSKALDKLRGNITLLAGLDHSVKGGHFAVHSFLSGVVRSEAVSMPDGNITLDQFVAEHIGATTRFPSLAIGDSTGLHGGCQLSWTRTGTRVPPIEGPSAVYRLLFEKMDGGDRAAVARRLANETSILDSVRDDAGQFRKRLSSADQHKFEEYLTAVRDVEQRVQLRRRWIDVPKPRPPFPPPRNTNLVEDLPLLYDLIALALQTESTNVVTLEIGGAFRPTHLGIQGDYHALSHHGKRAGHVESLITLDAYQIEHFARFLEKLASMTDAEGNSFLDTTVVLMGSGMGDANTHTNKNLPVVLAGGGFQHGSLLAFKQDGSDSPPLCNLFVSILQQLGIAVDRFGKSTGTLRGLTA